MCPFDENRGPISWHVHRTGLPRRRLGHVARCYPRESGAAEKYRSADRFLPWPFQPHLRRKGYRSSRRLPHRGLDHERATEVFRSRYRPVLAFVFRQGPFARGYDRFKFRKHERESVGAVGSTFLARHQVPLRGNRSAARKGQYRQERRTDHSGRFRFPTHQDIEGASRSSTMQKGPPKRACEKKATGKPNRKKGNSTSRKTKYTKRHCIFNDIFSATSATPVTSGADHVSPRKPASSACAPAWTRPGSISWPTSWSPTTSPPATGDTAGRQSAGLCGRRDQPLSSGRENLAG